jgi:ribonucleoside-diphosphate reductase alpha chain
MTKYEQVKDIGTEEYFHGNRFSIDAFASKYTLYDGETYVNALKRVCDEIASVEDSEEKSRYWSERWFDEIYNDWWHPAGSIMQGAGNQKSVSLSNCTTISLGAIDSENEWDSLEAIIRNTAYSVAKCAAYRQGLGVDFSRVRPKMSNVNNSANKSTGAVHWMSYIDSIAYYVGQKGRIPAMLFSISCSHPDIEEFIDVKKDYTKIQNANISVQCTDEFYKAVEKDGDWDLCFEIPEQKAGEKIYIDRGTASPSNQKDERGYYYICPKNREKEKVSKTVKARALLELIAKSMLNNAEPGIQNISVAKKYSNSDYVYDTRDELDSRIVSTNACSEQYLNRDGLCILSSINCGNFSSNVDEYKIELEKVASSVNRFLDNVVSYELKHKKYATDFQRQSLEKLRRTGAGYTNLAGWLFKSRNEYGSEASNEAVSEFTKWYNYYLYKSSIEIGSEKGSFGLFDKEKFEKSPFVKRMIKLGLKFDAMRNVTCSSIAPSGTLSLMFRDLVMSYGIEPAFSMYYWKRTRISGKYIYYFNVPSIVRKVFKEKGFEIPIDSDTIEDTWDGKRGKPIAEFIDANKDVVGASFKSDTEVKALDKLDMMSKVSKWVDSSISVTYMLPEDSKWQDVYEFIVEAHRKEVKSIAAFPDKKMYGIVSKIAFKDLAKKLQSEGVNIHPQNFSEEELKALNISKEQIGLQTSNAPSRPKELNADVHIATAKGEKYVIAVGLLNGQPYEVFGGKANGFGIKHKCEGKIIKHKSGQYGLEMGSVVIDDFSKHFTPEEQTIFRLASTSLRHGIPIEFTVEQLHKSTDDMFSLPSAVARVLRKYIKNGQKVLGKKCPNCQQYNTIIYHDGCTECPCGYKGCS